MRWRCRLVPNLKDVLGGIATGHGMRPQLYGSFGLEETKTGFLDGQVKVGSELLHSTPWSLPRLKGTIRSCLGPGLLGLVGLGRLALGRLLVRT